jgi:hypothetical protein
MSIKRYHVTASVGGWKSLPWPFGILDISFESMRLHSWLLSWWLKDRDFDSRDVKSIQVTKRLGTTRLLVVMDDGSQLKAELRLPMEKTVQLLRNCGYSVEGE